MDAIADFEGAGLDIGGGVLAELLAGGAEICGAILRTT